MKASPITGIFAILVSTAFAQTTPQKIKEISHVESSLIPPVRFEGEPAWNIKSRMEFYQVPGVSIAVIKNAEILWSKTYGFADLDSKTPVRSNTLFQVASMSKPVSAYAALKEVELGKLASNADVNLYLKSWKIPENNWTRAKTVTLKNIISHTAGLTVSGFPGYRTTDPIPTAVEVLSGLKPANTPMVYVDKLPGLNFRYSGGGYTVLQQMLVDIEGKDYSSIMEEKVLSPLGMKNSTFAQPLPELNKQFAATAYTVDGKKVEGRYHVYPEQAAAGLWSTAEDYARFVIYIQRTLNGKSSTIISKKMAEEFTSPYIEPIIGLGVFLEDYDGSSYFCHGGWNEGFSSYFVGNKTSGDGVVILTNTNKPEFINELVRAVALTYQWPNYLAPINKILPLSSQELNVNSGRYRSGKYGVIRVYSQSGKLMSVQNLDKPVELVKVSANTFVMRDRNVNVVFSKDTESGQYELVQVLRDKKIYSKNPKVNANDRTPLELILEANFKDGLKAFQKAKEQDSDDELLSEGFLNGAGYELLNQHKINQAIDIFKVNTVLYPKSENVYDSLAEAYLKSGQIDSAKKNYQKVREINPKNERVSKILETL
ncbi:MULTISPECIES: beta-lactamase family protein [Sphingobacterium]|uniref:beta-lactamase family protein n=1 Tax=Sphingobacterium TaxID=28453 RepID=UPI00257E49AE|nr:MULTISPECIES: beta-lactamase family protein [Sphingobacterium]